MRLLGKGTVTVNGKRLRFAPGAKVDIGGAKRTGREDDHGYIGYSEQAKMGRIEGKIPMAANTSLREIEGWDDVTIRYEADTGQSFVGAHWTVEEVPAFTDGADSSADLVFFGPAMEEVTANG